MARYNEMISWSDEALQRTLDMHRAYKAQAQRHYDSAVAMIALIEREVTERTMERLREKAEPIIDITFL